MKRLKNMIKTLFILILIFSLSSCKSGNEPSKPKKTEKEPVQIENVDISVSDEEAALLESAYQGRTAYQGEMHDHSSLGDGQCSLAQWKSLMNVVGLDFAAILDHNGVYHMFSPDWDDTVFIGGSEASCASVEGSKLHYNMVFAEPQGLINVVYDFPEFGYKGAPNGYFHYPTFTRYRFEELSRAIRENGGYLVLPHPTVSIADVPASDDPDCYWYGDYNGLEVIYVSAEHEYTKSGYELWKKLLAKGRRIYACSGGDGHTVPDADALTTVYAEEKNAASILSHAREGDSTAGGAAIRMLLGDTVTGGHTEYRDGDRLIISVSDFHKKSFLNNQTYNIRIFADGKIIADAPITLEKTNYFALDVDKSVSFYRAEVYQTSSIAKTVIAYGNPIWNDLIKPEK